MSRQQRDHSDYEFQKASTIQWEPYVPNDDDGTFPGVVDSLTNQAEEQDSFVSSQSEARDEFPAEYTHSSPLFVQRKVSRQPNMRSRAEVLLDNIEASQTMERLNSMTTRRRRESVVEIRPSYDCIPMKKEQRVKIRLKQRFLETLSPLCRRICCVISQPRHDHAEGEPAATDDPEVITLHDGRQEHESVEDEESESHGQRRRGKAQFRLSTYQHASASALNTSFFDIAARARIHVYDDDTGIGNQCSCFGFEPDTLVRRYLNWTFRQSFFAVMMSIALGYFVLSLIFALFLVWSGRATPECINVAGSNFSSQESTSAPFFRDFGDAFALSWQTLSTTGYGVVNSAASTVTDEHAKCTIVVILCSLEAFIGILFAGFSGAILFGKVARIRSIAQIVFSDVAVVRYGLGVASEDATDAAAMSDDHDESGSIDFIGSHTDRLPYPTLEFRIANMMHDIAQGEIVDCSLNIVASVDGSRARDLLQESRCRQRHKKRERVRRPLQASAVDEMISEGLIDDKLEVHTSVLRNIADCLHEQTSRTHQPFDEDPTGKISSKKVFARLDLDTRDHPYFNRVWTARHTLDLESPILAADAKKAMRLNHGYWPKELNSAESVRACLNADQILVSFSGTSNADANPVYAQKVYDFQSIKVGYVFVDMLFRDNAQNSKLEVDMDVINDLMEQRGGGGEPLLDEQGRDITDMLIL